MVRFWGIVTGELKFLSAWFNTSIKVFFYSKIMIDLVGKSELLGIIIPLTSGAWIFISGLYCVILQLTCFQGNMFLFPEKKPSSVHWLRQPWKGGWMRWWMVSFCLSPLMSVSSCANERKMSRKGSCPSDLWGELPGVESNQLVLALGFCILILNFFPSAMPCQRSYST